MIMKLMATLRTGDNMNAWTWTVMQLMTDTAVLEQDRAADEIRTIMLDLSRKLDSIIARVRS